jgi:hypothetical protein
MNKGEYYRYNKAEHLTVVLNNKTVAKQQSAIFEYCKKSNKYMDVSDEHYDKFNKCYKKYTNVRYELKNYRNVCNLCSLCEKWKEHQHKFREYYKKSVEFYDKAFPVTEKEIKNNPSIEFDRSSKVKKVIELSRFSGSVDTDFYTNDRFGKVKELKTNEPFEKREENSNKVNLMFELIKSLEVEGE